MREKLAILLVLASAAAAFAAAGEAPTVGEEAETQKILLERGRMAAQYKDLGAFLKSRGVPDWAQQWLDRPEARVRIERLAGLAADPGFRDNAKQLVGSPDLKWYGAAAAAVFLFFVVLRAWSLAATDRWWARLGVRLALIPLFFLGQFLAAYFTLGQPAVRLLWKVIACVA